MAKKIRIKAGNVTVEAELNSTRTAQAIWDALPIRAHGSRWGGEMYFGVDAKGYSENAKAEVGVGELAFWPPGNAICIFWGPTPASHGSEPRAASPVTVWGRIAGDATIFEKVPSGTEIVIERVA
jgi:hypothetical protein